jgi:hypothetical protein
MKDIQAPTRKFQREKSSFAKQGFLRGTFGLPSSLAKLNSDLDQKHLI